MFCPFCDNEVPEGVFTCPHCMAKLGSPTAQHAQDVLQQVQYAQAQPQAQMQQPAQTAQPTQQTQQWQQPSPSPSPSSGGNGSKIAIIAVVAVVIVAICAFAGLAFAGVINIGGGSQSSAAVKKETPDEFLKKAVDKVSTATDFDINVVLDSSLIANNGKQVNGVSCVA